MTEQDNYYAVAKVENPIFSIHPSEFPNLNNEDIIKLANDLYQINEGPDPLFFS